jgi:DNA mismatch endonuclease, patch repair protein
MPRAKRRLTTRTSARPSWASSPGVRRSMQSNRPRDTTPEVAVRQALHRLGLRYRTHLRPIAGDRCQVDVAFTRWRVAVFVDGCFWHGCPQHATRPATNREWWGSKLDNNVARDRRTDERLQAAGWTVLRYWEHMPVDEVVQDVCRALRERGHDGAATARDA